MSRFYAILFKNRPDTGMLTHSRIWSVFGIRNVLLLGKLLAVTGAEDVAFQFGNCALLLLK